MSKITTMIHLTILTSGLVDYGGQGQEYSWPPKDITMAVTTFHDKEISGKIQLLPDTSYYGIFLAMIRLGTMDQLAQLHSAFTNTLPDEFSAYDGIVSERVMALPDITFYGAMLALIEGADNNNMARFIKAFPEVVREGCIRYHGPGRCVSPDEWLEVYPDDAEVQMNDPDGMSMLNFLFARAYEKADQVIRERSNG